MALEKIDFEEIVGSSQSSNPDSGANARQKLERNFNKINDAFDDYQQLLSQKADFENNGKNVVYAINGKLSDDNSLLASDTQNGLLSKEYFEKIKSNNEKINEIDMGIDNLNKSLMNTSERFLTSIVIYFNCKDNNGDVNLNELKGNLRFWLNSKTPIDNGLFYVKSKNNDYYFQSPEYGYGEFLIRIKPTEENDIITISTSEVIEFILLSDDDRIKHIDVISRDINFYLVDFNSMNNVGTYDIRKNKYMRTFRMGTQTLMEFIDLSENKYIENITTFSNKNIKTLNVFADNLKSLTLLNSTSLSQINFEYKKIPLLIITSLNIKNCPLLGTQWIESIEPIWIPTTNATLTLDKSVYDQLSTNIINKLLAKNITFNF